MIKPVPLKEIKLGMCLAEPVFSKSGREIFKADFYFTSFKQVEELSDFYIKEVKIDFTRSLVDDSTPAEQEKKKDEVRKVFENPDKIHSKLKENVAKTKEIFEAGEAIIKDFMEKAKAGKPLDEKIVTMQAKKLMDSVHEDKLAALSLLDMKGLDDRTYQHSVNVATMSVALAEHIKLPKERQFTLCQGAFWHDIGKCKFSSYMTRNVNRLQEHELALFQKHTVFGVEILDKNDINDDIIVEIVAYHHQGFDGSGYPKMFAGARQRRYASIVSIVNHYETLISGVDRVNPTTAIGTIFNLSGTMFDPRLVNSFIKVIGIYPMGSLVELSNGMIASVIAFSPVDLLKPVVKTLFHKDTPNIPAVSIISLIDSDLQIVDSHTEAKVNILDVVNS